MKYEIQTEEQFVFYQALKTSLEHQLEDPDLLCRITGLNPRDSHITFCLSPQRLSLFFKTNSFSYINPM